MKTTYLLFLLLIIYAEASSQIINVESSRMQSDTVGWKGGVGAALSLTQNTEKIFQLNLEAQLQYKTSKDRGIWLILGNLGLLKIGSDRFISDDLVHLRYNRKINEWLRWEVFGQYQNNIVTQIDSRTLFGTGPRFKLISSPKFRLYAASLFMYESEKERTTPVISHNDFRNSSYVSFTWLPRENIEMISTTYFQPLLKKLSDYRLLNQIAFAVKATPHLGLEVKWNYLHDRFPAGTAPRTTYMFATGLRYDL
ncbi:MAG: DUF481 domain-containing protein [Chitinophagaceae bacterium]